MKWTTDPPTEPGWYWIRRPSDNEAQIVQVEMLGGQACYYEAGVYDMDWPGPNDLWSGPLLPPKVTE